MFKITKEENDRMETELEAYHKRMNEIEKSLDADFDGDVSEEAYAKLMLNQEYKDLEDKAFATSRTLNRSFVSEAWHDNAGFDYQLTEMKA